MNTIKIKNIDETQTIKIENVDKTQKIKIGVSPIVVNNDYEPLKNKPRINGVELIGDKTSSELGIEPYDDTDIRNQINQVNELAEQNERDIVNLGNRVTGIEEDLLEQEESINHLDDIKVDKVEGKSLIDDTEIARLKDVTNYNDTGIKQEIANLKTNKQDKLIAGENIIIENNIISSTGGGSGTGNYNDLENKPSINNIELTGNKTLSDLGIISYDDTEIRQEISNLDVEVDNLTDNVNKIALNVDENTNDINTLEQNYTTLRNEVLEQEETLNHLDDTKADKTSIPTKNSQLENDSNYATKSEIPDVSEFIKKTVDDLVNYYKKSETYTQSEVNQLIGAIKTISMKVVPERPETGEANIIYLVPSSKATIENIYEEWIYVDNKWELIGSTQVDLTNYYTKEEINTLLFDYITSNDLEEALKDYVTVSMKYDFVKDGIVNNTNQLTDAEKLKVETWLGLSENYLTYYNATPYQVNGDYVPAHKKYVDDADTLLREKISEIELSKFPNATIIGTPTILQGQVSNFSLTDFLEFPFLVDFRGNPFEINFAFTTGTDIDNQQNILDSDFGLAFAIRSKHLVMALSFNGTSWATEQTGSLILQPQTTYRIKITWNRLLYKVQYSLDGGVTYVDDITFGATQAPYPKQMYIGVGKLARNYFKGIINLNYADVSVDGNKIWLGMDDAGLALRMSISMDNIDSAGIQKVKDIASEIIPTNVSSFNNDAGYLTQHQSLAEYYTKQETNNLLNNKVDKVEGKQLSTNDFTNEEKTKLSQLNNYDDAQIKQDISDLQGSLSSKVGFDDLNNFVKVENGKLVIG